MKNATIAIVGAGAVGTTTAFSLLFSNIASTIMLLDADTHRCEGEVRDLADALPFTKTTSIMQATYDQARNATIIIIAAGQRQKPGQSRRELVSANHTIINAIIKNLKPINPQSIVIVVTNPVDVLSHSAQIASGLPPAQVIGSGTLLDTQRLHRILAQRLNVAQNSFQALVLGEHGEDQFVAWSTEERAKNLVSQLSQQDRDGIEQHVKDEVQEIISRKGATYFGVAACVTDVCKNILLNQRRVVPVSCYVERYNTYLNMPVVLGEHGVEHIVDIRFTEEEQKKLDKAAQAVITMSNSVRSL